MKILLAYFSRAGENYFGGQYRYIDKGNTEIAAEIIEKLCDVDVFKIEMKQPYSDVYQECIKQAKKDLESKTKPEIKKCSVDIKNYDKIILAYPNYWSTVPMAVFTFLESFDFSDKIIYPLCTNEGSGMGKSESDIKRTAKCSVVKGLPIIGSKVEKSEKTIKNWLKENYLIKE